MTEPQDDQQAKLTDRIQKLLDRASHPATPEGERDACLKKADALMHSHKIDQAMLASRAGATQAEREKRGQPIHEEWEWISRSDEFFDHLLPVMGDLCRLCDVRVVFSYGVVHLVGYPEDIEYVKMLWLSAYLTFSSKLYPKWDPKVIAGPLAQGMNIRLHAEAGYKWLEIWQRALDAGHPLMHSKGHAIPAPPEDNGWMKREMGKAYAADGMEKPKLAHGRQQYRASFAHGFAGVIGTRCFEMERLRRSRERETSGADVVLSREANAVRDLMNKLFPPETLGSHRGPRKTGPVNERAASLGAAAGRSVDMAGSARMSAGNGPKAVGR